MRASAVLTVAMVLLIGYLASRTRVDIGIAVAILGLVLGYWRGVLAIPVVAFVAAVACFGIAKALVGCVLASALVGFVYFGVLREATLNSSTKSVWGGRGAGWWGFGDGTRRSDF